MMNAQLHSTLERRLAIVDGHVHVHARFDPASVFSHAWSNLASRARASKHSCTPALYLLLAECAGTDFFGRLESEGADSAGGWQVARTREPTSLVVSDPARQVILVAGRQVVTAEGLEVLLLGTREQMPDGVPARQLLQSTSARNMLRVLPWGVGKWWFERGRLVRSLIEELGAPDLFVGDSGLRPWFWTRPALLGEAERLGARQLNGTDPLPLPGDAARAGSSGFEITVDWDEDRPAGALIAALTNPAAHPLGFLAPAGAARFLLSQFRMQMRRRTRMPP